MYLQSFEQAADVVPEGEDHQSEQEDYPDGLRPYQEAVARLPPCYHFIDGEDNMASVERRYRQQVHHSEHYGQQGEYVHETVPVPPVRKYLPYGDEAVLGVNTSFRSLV